jgi:hypothetical protein
MIRFHHAATETAARAGLAAALLFLAHGARARSLEDFDFLLRRSPFSLPTAEESSPLADRFLLTGAASWDGIQRIFLMDKISQQRHVVVSDPNTEGMRLLEFKPDTDPQRISAKVQIGTEVATLVFQAPPAPAGVAAAQPGAQPGAPPMPGAPNSGRVISAGAENPHATPPRRIIRRRVISNTPSQPGQPQ